MEANVEIDITAINMLFKSRDELAAKNVTFVMAKGEQDLYLELEKLGFLKNISA